MSKTVKGTKKLNTANTLTNAVSFLVDQAIKRTVNTAELVAVNAADQNSTGGSGGYGAATPLVTYTDGFDNALAVGTISKMPFFRPQAGKAAIVMDPQPGDKAIAVFTKRDSSGVGVGTKEAVRPASHRSFDQADGFLINGFLGEEPEIWLELNPVSGDISLSTKAANIDISCRESGDIEITTTSGNVMVKAKAGDVEVAATSEARTKAPQIILDGNVRITGGLEVIGNTTGAGGSRAKFYNGVDIKQGVLNQGGIKNQGGLENSGPPLVSNNVTLDSHQHPGVEAPIKGT